MHNVIVLLTAVLFIGSVVAFVVLVGLGISILEDPALLGRFFGQIVRGFEEVQ